MWRILELNELGGWGDVFDDLGGLGADAEVAEVGEFFVGRPGAAFVGDLKGRSHHGGDVALSVGGEIGEMSNAGDVLGPTGVHGVDGFKGFAHGFVAGDVSVALAAGVFVGDADEEITLPVTFVGQGIGFIDHQILEAAVAQSVAFFYGVEPADHTLATGGGTEFKFLEQRGERVSFIHLREERVGADLGVVGFGHAKRVHGLHGNTGAFKEFGRVGVGGGDVGGEAVAFVEPVGLAKFAEDSATGGQLAANEFANFADLGTELGASFPVGFDQLFEVEREGGVSAETGEVEVFGGEDTGVDRGLVGARFGSGEFIEESGEGLGINLADVLDGADGAFGALGDFTGVEIGAGEEVGVGDLPLANLVGVGGRDASAGGTAGLFLEDVLPVVFPSEIEEAVNKVGDHGALVDGEAVDDDVAFGLEGRGFPPDFTGVGDDAAADGEVGDVFLDDAGGQKVELHAGGGVAGIGAAVDLEDGGDGVGRVSEFFADFRDEAAFAFVAE